MSTESVGKSSLPIQHSPLTILLKYICKRTFSLKNIFIIYVFKNIYRGGRGLGKKHFFWDLNHPPGLNHVS